MNKDLENFSSNLDKILTERKRKMSKTFIYVFMLSTMVAAAALGLAFKSPILGASVLVVGGTYLVVKQKLEKE